MRCTQIDDVTTIAKMDAPTKLEFDVKMTCGKCVNAVKNAFQGVQGVKSLDVDLERGQVIVESNLTSDRVKSIIESSGRLAVLKGMGGTKVKGLGAAVSIMEAGNELVKGVVRFVQTDSATLIIDGTIDGLRPGKHALCVHECGDISDGCKSCGDLFGLAEKSMRAVGDIGDIEANPDGRAEFRFVSERLKVGDLIGRSMMVHSCPSDLAHSAREINNRLTCGIIARSAGLFENTKKICACDGVTLWDERNKPLAGPGRQNQANL